MGFGSSGMIQSIRNNAKQLVKRKSYFEKDIDSKSSNSKKIVDHKKMSPAQFVAFKQQLKENELRRQKRLIVIFGGVMTIILSAIIYFLFYY